MPFNTQRPTLGEATRVAVQLFTLTLTLPRSDPDPNSKPYLTRSLP